MAIILETRSDRRYRTSSDIDPRTRPEVILRITDEFDFVMADKWNSPEDALLAALEGMAREGKLPKYAWADGTPMFFPLPDIGDLAPGGVRQGIIVPSRRV